jgi:hypothetical protein
MRLTKAPRNVQIIRLKGVMGWPLSTQSCRDSFRPNAGAASPAAKACEVFMRNTRAVPGWLQARHITPAQATPTFNKARSTAAVCRKADLARQKLALTGSFLSPILLREPHSVSHVVPS